MVLGGASDPTYAQLKGDHEKASMTLVGKDGQPHTIEHGRFGCLAPAR